MTKEVLQYCLRGIVQHLNGDIDRFNDYVEKATRIYENEKFIEKCKYPISNLIPEETKKKLYQMVS